MAARRLEDDFKAGLETAKIGSLREALVRAVLVGTAAVVAVFSPVPFWRKTLIFFFTMFLIGAAVQMVKGNRS